MLYGLLGGFLGLMAFALWLEGKVRQAERGLAAEGMLDDIRTAQTARDGLERDPAYAERVRARFTR